jgi:single-strand DNA-binding protein
MNVLSFTGNLGKDAEQRFTQSGDSIVGFSVALKSGFGEKAKTTWMRCTMFGKRGESVLPYLKKGTQVGVSGEFALSEWVDKEGQTKTSAECRVNDLTLLGSKPQGDSQPAQQQSRPAQSRPQQSSNFEDEGEIPF